MKLSLVATVARRWNAHYPRSGEHSYGKSLTVAPQARMGALRLPRNGRAKSHERRGVSGKRVRQKRDQAFRQFVEQHGMRTAT